MPNDKHPDAATPKLTLESVEALARISRILSKLSEPDQQRVIAALGELRA